MARDKARMEDLRAADWYSARKPPPSLDAPRAGAEGTAAVFSPEATKSVRICGDFWARAQRFFLPRLGYSTPRGRLRASGDPYVDGPRLARGGVRRARLAAAAGS